jgi:hypothetical protein
VNYPRVARRLFLLLAIIGAATPIVGRLAGGSWPPFHVWVPVVLLGVAGAQFGRSWRRPVSRMQLDEYWRWRAQTELNEDERAVQLRGKPGEALEPNEIPAPRVRPPQQSSEERRRDFFAAAGRAFVVKSAIGFSAATLISVSVLPYAILEHDFAIAVFGVVIVLFAPFCGFVAFSSWWEVRHGELYEPPNWLKNLGRGLLRALYSNVGR